MCTACVTNHCDQMKELTNQRPNQTVSVRDAPEIFSQVFAFVSYRNSINVGS